MAVNGIGRPLIYDPEYHPAKAEELAENNLIDIEIAKALEISSFSLYEWKKKYPDFSEALKRGKAVADQKVVKSLFKRAMGYEITETKKTDDGHSVKIETVDKLIPGDTTAMIFWLKNRMPEEWRDKVQNEISGPEGAPIETKSTIEIIAKDEALRLGRLISGENRTISRDIPQDNPR